MAPMVQDPSVEVLLEKSPDHAFCMEDIARMFPQARFVHVIRDSRAVAASLMAASKESWGHNWTTGKAKDAALRWRRSVRAARSAGAQLDPAQYIEVYYEDLAADTDNQLRRLFDFIELEVSPEEILRITSEQSFEKQKAIGGTPFQRKGELERRGMIEIKEPPGFFRKGKAEGWKQELGFFQKLVIWRYTRRIMQGLGYDWNGRCKPPVEYAPASKPLRALARYAAL